MKIRIPVAREGWPFIFLGLFFCIILISIGYIKTALFFMTATICVIIFFRDPERNIVKDEDLILSPADGRILDFYEKPAKDEGMPPLKQISVFMSVLNCHINRIPISGQVTRCEYNPGKFLPAFKEKASEFNEQNTIHIKNDRMEIGIRQIAGLIARRIVCRAKPGEFVDQGNRFGLIRFGSRVDILLPPGVEILVHPGQKVKAGLSSIARIRL
ncbi:MAG: phosphatidylserine decarboxylase family protein [bacterium]